MTDIPSFDTIRFEVADNVATITLNRPERLNSMPPAMADDIRTAFDYLSLFGARALLITGEGRGFCSGADLAGDRSASAVGGGANSRKALRNHYNPMLLALANLDIPVVVAVNGPAAGVGCSFALSGDFTLAGKSAYFLQAFVNIGMNMGILPVTGITLPFVSQGSSSLWTFLIGIGVLQSILLHHRKLAFQSG